MKPRFPQKFYFMYIIIFMHTVPLYITWDRACSYYYEIYIQFNIIPYKTRYVNPFAYVGDDDVDIDNECSYQIGRTVG